VLISREAIATMIPHAGSMCLLDGVLSWDASRIRCSSRTHRDRHNPLRVDEKLPALCGIEYAAQAMAIHGVLAGSVGNRPRLGYLASLREVRCSRTRLDDLEGDLTVEAERLMGEESHVIYSFEVRVGDVEVLRGRAAVVLEASRAGS
jgi:predicted hotdog family 3-hydroxylacyl-ACP dehydratase